MKFNAEKLLVQPAVADGGWSTQLWQRGLSPAEPVELANVAQPGLVRGLAQEYVAAGARILTTNTFAANRLALAGRGVTADVEALNRRGAELAREAAGEKAVFVAGAIGPSGKILAVRETNPDELSAAFTAQARALAEGGADLLVLETFSELAEVLVALAAAKSTGLPVIASLSFDAGPQRTRTNMGAEAGECAAALEDAGADGVGTNCGAGIRFALPAVVALRAATRLPLWVKPSAGAPELEHGQPAWRMPPEEFCALAGPLLDAGANVVGGCCGCGPEHVRRLAALVRRRG